MTRRRELLLNLLLSLASIAVCLLAAEIVLRFFPVSTGLRSMPVTAADPVLRFTPNRPFTNSLGWTMHNVVHGRVNNAGFVNDQDYVREGPPLIAVIGDSFIEAQMVPYAQSLQGRLAAALKDKLRVYSFAGSGAPLSQYLIWAGYAVKEYGARAVVINVVGNDFDESLSAYRLGPGFWQYAPDASGVLQLRLNPHRAGTLISLARHSALARYVIINLGIQNRLFAIRAFGELIFGKPANAAPRYAGNTDASADEKRVRDSLAAIDAFFRDVPERVGLPPERVLFTLDGFRTAEAAQAGAGTYFDLMRRAFIEKAAALGYEAIDLDTRFIPRHARTGESFEFADDNHWNAAGHEVAAEAVLESKLLARLKQ
jgi:lysophospholipase L1-like esterase